MSHTDQILDTSPAAHREHFALLRRRGMAGRAAMTFDASDALRETLASGVRHRHPDYSDREIRLATIRLMLGAELFAAVYPDETVQP